MIHTAYDVMKEFLITDADLDGKYEIPKIPKTFIHPGKDTVDFAESLGCGTANLYNKYKRNNFSLNELEEIAAAVGCNLEITFSDKQGN